MQKQKKREEEKGKEFAKKRYRVGYVLCFVCVILCTCRFVYFEKQNGEKRDVDGERKSAEKNEKEKNNRGKTCAGKRSHGKLYDKFCHECKYLEYISVLCLALLFNVGSEIFARSVQSSKPTYALSADYFHISPNTCIQSVGSAQLSS